MTNDFKTLLMKILMNRYLLILAFFIVGLVSCNNEPSCSIVTTTVAVDENGNYEITDWGKPNISIEKKETIRKLLDTCRVGYVYEIEETCRMQSDTTYFILKSIPYKIETTRKCEISNMKAVETISEYLNLENTSIEIFNALAENSYFIIMPEGFCNIPVSWIASVSDTHLSSDLVDSLKNLSNKEYPIYQYDKDLNEL